MPITAETVGAGLAPARPFPSVYSDIDPDGTWSDWAGASPYRVPYLFWK
ncbi:MULTISPECIES: hypothetical protein [Xanthocytophaga]|uniref:Uncharacterized protein n=2 Tax=Xanthocytophaga TaxID=3078918 RepID=A0AAE3QMM8_9BACT|nr:MULTISPECIES: hypothetical protein [Xanthocytophaga]MDJ1480230.1 hypothetical protein [Xanthocytophaga flavus]MDJ1504023.1 hypothetical protein [Xanthocytophaga agilis]